jgi:hypothetical protein
MNDDLIKPDTNKPVVPDMDSDTPSITSEVEDIPTSGSSLPTTEVPQPAPLSSAESPQPMLPEPPAPPIAPSTPAEPLLTAVASTLPSADSTEEKPHKPWMRIILIIVVALLLVAGIVYAAYKVGNSRGYKNGQTAMSTEMSAATIKVPEHATMVAQCAVGEGTQYVLPSDIPQGPIYNVWNSKVTGIEFMLAESKIAANKTLDLALKNQKYDHIDVMYEAAGHAGFTEPHYHIVLSMISYADEQKITCDSSTSDSSHDSHDMSSMDM